MKGKIEIFSFEYEIEDISVTLKQEGQIAWDDLYYEFYVGSLGLNIERVRVCISLSDIEPGSDRLSIYPDSRNVTQVLSSSGECLDWDRLSKLEILVLEQVIRAVCEDKAAIRNAYSAFWRKYIQEKRDEAQGLLEKVGHIRKAADKVERDLETVQKSW